MLNRDEQGLLGAIGASMAADALLDHLPNQSTLEAVARHLKPDAGSTTTGRRSGSRTTRSSVQHCVPPATPLTRRPLLTPGVGSDPRSS